MIQDQLTVGYKEGQKANWTGRLSAANLPPQYWHQIIALRNINTIETQADFNIGLIGYACDEGVRRNLGNVGAVQGPKVLREKLSTLPVHFRGMQVADLGDIICVDQHMEDCQKALSKSITKLLKHNVFPIVIGGGHDMAYGHYLGIKNFTKQKSIGIINFDAHFDLRPVSSLPNSGTPFNQIFKHLQSSGTPLHYFAIGIQKQSNTKELFAIAKQEGVTYAYNTECESGKDIEALQLKLSAFMQSVDYLYITIDMDGFSSAYAPGVSAASPFGFTPKFVYTMLAFLFRSKKVISCDIAELNPVVDFNKHTSSLAAKLVDVIVENCCKLV